MWLSGFTRASARPAVARFVPALALALLVAGCASSGGSGGISSIFSRSASNDTPEIDPEFFLKAKYCPPVNIRVGSETFQTFESGQDGVQSAIRYQASLGRTARECSRPTPDTMSVKIGLEGRVVAGPKGGAGNVDLPIRIAVIKQSDNKILHSSLYRLTVPVQAPQFSADFSQVFDQVSFTITPQDQDMIVYIGFDDGPG
ncbi:MAG: hypothetical protein ACTSP2_07330 [Alphaproteobacteria bacterium]